MQTQPAPALSVASKAVAKRTRGRVLRHGRRAGSVRRGGQERPSAIDGVVEADEPGELSGELAPLLSLLRDRRREHREGGQRRRRCSSPGRRRLALLQQ